MCLACFHVEKCDIKARMHFACDMNGITKLGVGGRIHNREPRHPPISSVVSLAFRPQSHAFSLKNFMVIEHSPPPYYSGYRNKYIRQWDRSDLYNIYSLQDISFARETPVYFTEHAGYNDERMRERTGLFYTPRYSRYFVLDQTILLYKSVWQERCCFVCNNEFHLFSNT